jgi:hypothetical protein
MGGKLRSYGPWWRRVLCFFGLHTDCHFYEMNDDERRTREANDPDGEGGPCP